MSCPGILDPLATTSHARCCTTMPIMAPVDRGTMGGSVQGGECEEPG